MADASAPALRFLSLFVPDLADAVARYTAMLGVAPTAQDADAPTAHPYAAISAPFAPSSAPISSFEYPGPQ